MSIFLHTTRATNHFNRSSASQIDKIIRKKGDTKLIIFSQEACKINRSRAEMTFQWLEESKETGTRQLKNEKTHLGSGSLSVVIRFQKKTKGNGWGERISLTIHLCMSGGEVSYR